MRPQRETKRPRYAESPESPDPEASIEESEPTMTSLEPQRKRTRYNEESPQQQMGYRIAATGLPLALPHHASPTPAPASYITSSSPSSARAQTATPLAQRSSNAPQLIGGSYTLQAAGLSIPTNIPAQEMRRRQAEMERELAYQEANPPALPMSQIPDLPPKPTAEDWVPFPDEPIPENEHRRIEAENNRIAKTNQRIERERNNQAAKKSRQKRLEALGNSQRITYDRSASGDWWRLRAMALGASASDYDEVPQQIKDGMVKVIEQRVTAVDEENENIRKQEEARKRIDRTRARAARKGEREASTPERRN
ncbi:hypothetical protein EDB81DRAFT_902472 [Dactylonectria macrodidyma]|uniref:BZIP domain-containing protein n=1 Tax=Dactylonectria macrodidyma TaxID=307937 RepID=A0A9P9IY59_9HYPO|nr:hypothetical protein EDB81DRAFT_902472 [Dactylonectria macrodidyma]